MGTSSVKMILIDETGAMKAESNIEYEVQEPAPGWKEIDPEVWFQATEKGLKELLSGIKSVNIAGIGITGQMHTTVFINREGNSIRPAIMWNDVRTKDYINRLKQRITDISSIAHISKIISTGSPAVNLLWLKENEPENFQKIHKFLIGPDYLVYRLTGSISTDYCESSTSSMYNMLTDQWSEEMLSLLDFPAEILPEIKGSGCIAGKITKEIAKKFGLNEQVKVIVGTGDNPAAAISTGCLIGKYPVLSLGTSGVFMIPTDKVDFSKKGKNIKFSLDGREIMTLVQGVVQSAGSSINWWLKKILGTENIAEIMNPDSLKNAGQEELIFYPHLVGDKTLFADPYLRGAFLGLGTDTTKEDMCVAVLEGISFGIKQTVEGMQVDKCQLEGLRVTGGGAKNELWMQLLSDLLQVTVQQLDGTTGAGLGIALLAGQSCGNIGNLEKLSASLIRIKKVFYPNKEKGIYYQRKYERYCKIYDALKLIG